LRELSLSLNRLEDFDLDFADDETPGSAQGFHQQSYKTGRGGAAAAARPKMTAKPSQWKNIFSQLRQLVPVEAEAPAEPWPASREILYIIDLQASTGARTELVLDVAFRDPKKNGGWCKPRGLQLAVRHICDLPDPQDIDILTRLVGARDINYYTYAYSTQQVVARYQLARAIAEPLLPLICGTGRCFYRQSRNMDLSPPLRWDSGASWELRFTVDGNPARKNFLLTSHLQRGEQKLALKEPALIHASGIMIAHGYLAPLKANQPLEWLPMLQAHPEIQVPKEQAEDLVEELSSLKRLPQMDIPAELRVEEVRVPPQFYLMLS
jgi:hypothetical protein